MDKILPIPGKSISKYRNPVKFFFKIKWAYWRGELEKEKGGAGIISNSRISEGQTDVFCEQREPG